MALEQFLNHDQLRVAEAYALMEYACDISFFKGTREKEEKYADLLLGELTQLIEKYGISRSGIYAAMERIDAENLEENEILERADKIIKHA